MLNKAKSYAQGQWEGGVFEKIVNMVNMSTSSFIDFSTQGYIDKKTEGKGAIKNTFIRIGFGGIKTIGINAFNSLTGTSFLNETTLMKYLSNKVLSFIYTMEIIVPFSLKNKSYLAIAIAKQFNESIPKILSIQNISKEKRASIEQYIGYGNMALQILSGSLRGDRKEKERLSGLSSGTKEYNEFFKNTDKINKQLHDKELTKDKIKSIENEINNLHDSPIKKQLEQQLKIYKFPTPGLIDIKNKSIADIISEKSLIMNKSLQEEKQKTLKSKTKDEYNKNINTLYNSPKKHGFNIHIPDDNALLEKANSFDK